MYARTWAKVKAVVLDTCELKQLALLEGFSIYNEWMIACRTRGAIKETYYVSRSYGNNEVIVFTKISDGKMKIEYVQGKISVVVDKAVSLIGNTNDIED